MLYLEDYLEMIENLPIEMRDRFTEMREMDLEVQNAMDSLDDRVKSFFKKCAPPQQPKQEWKDETFGDIKKDYGKALEDADEKVQLANQIYEMVDRYLRRLDQELSKFKMELEADNAGITEVLERRSLEMDSQPHTLNSHRPERRRTTLPNHTEKRASAEKVLSNLAHEAVRDTLTPNRSSASSSSSSSISSSTYASAASQNPAMSYSLGAGSNAAIAAAASRAIGATLVMSQGRRTASLKASYEAVTRSTDLTKELFTQPEFSSGSNTPTPIPTEPPPPKSSARSKKSSARSQQQQQLPQPTPPQQLSAPSTPAPTEDLPPVEEYQEMIVDDPANIVNWGYDPNEPRYCICNDVSYGEMVGCDNSDCPIEWFHYGCVGLAQAPKGKWYCPQCTAAMKRRGRK